MRDVPHRVFLLQATAWLFVLPFGLTPAFRAADHEGENTIRFRSLEIHDRRQALSNILRRLQEERDSKRVESRMFAELAGLIQEVGQQPTDEAKLLQCMRAHAGLSELGDTLKSSRLSRLAVLDAVRGEASSQESLSPETGRVLREADREIRLMMERQQSEMRKVVTLRNRVRTMVDAIPPPASFTTEVGVTMRLTGRGREAFYVSGQPISSGLYRTFLDTLATDDALIAWEAFSPKSPPDSPATGVTWGGAQGFRRWFSSRERGVYVLPSARHCRLLGAGQPVSRTATWLNDVWLPKSYETRRDLKRFATDFFGVWDPTGTLGSGKTVFGEVPFARYTQLGFYLITATSTGVELRLRRLRASLP